MAPRSPLDRTSPPGSPTTTWPSREHRGLHRHLADTGGGWAGFGGRPAVRSGGDPVAGPARAGPGLAAVAAGGRRARGLAVVRHRVRDPPAGVAQPAAGAAAGVG